MSRAGWRVDFDPRLQISPYTVYRRLREGPEIVLVDLRPQPARRPPSLSAALAWPGPGWRAEDDADVVLFDDDGRGALELARRLREEGCRRVRALFGGLELWDLALGALEQSL
jgi:rhodanese-related sulfurtransferase